MIRSLLHFRSRNGRYFNRFERNVIQSDSIRLGHVGKGGRQCNAESQTEIEITVEIGIWPYSLIAERCLFKGVGANPTRHNFM